MKFFYGPEADMFTFFKIPKLLFAPPYKQISTDAKLLYGLMLDRMSLSALDEHWTEDDGRIFIYFPISEVMELLNISDKPATKLYRELESVGLIQRKRQGLGKPTKIYVSKFFQLQPEEEETEKAEEASRTDPQSLNRKNTDSRIVKNTILETENIRPLPLIKTESSETEIKDTQIDPLRKPPTPKRKPPEPILSGVPEMEAQVKDQIGYEALCANRPWDTPAINGIVSLIADICTSQKPSYRINGELRQGDDVRRRLRALNYEEIEAVLEAVYSDSKPVRIKNMRGYLITALYNAEATSNQYLEHNGTMGEPSHL